MIGGRRIKKNIVGGNVSSDCNETVTYVINIYKTIFANNKTFLKIAPRNLTPANQCKHQNYNIEMKLNYNLVLLHNTINLMIMICTLWSLLSSFFPHLISAVAHWMSTMK